MADIAACDDDLALEVAIIDDRVTRRATSSRPAARVGADAVTKRVESIDLAPGRA